MARVGILFGVLLCALTAVALMTSMAKSPAQFVPMMLGIPIQFCGVVGLNPHRRRSAVSVAAGIAVLGVLLGAGTIMQWIPEIRDHQSDEQQLLVTSVMLLMCLVFAVFSARWISRLPSRLSEKTLPLPTEEPRRANPGDAA
ncbi:hypothetical protein [Stieleria varia]|uniref:Uncharacterized protein n=1 Tax=Stieleria varia TaxID=2528005 RepID=A0A5C6A258_9BACT|nr:hypothetical protein [Stieleria varia]TWT93942.1 hypothetical protein Pla52n_57700 [Stieleria varia]